MEISMPVRERIEAAHAGRFTRLNSGQVAAAAGLLEDLLAAAAPYGVDLALLDRVTDLPGACLDVIAIRRRDSRRGDEVARG